MDAFSEAEVETEVGAVDGRTDPRCPVSSPIPSFPAKIEPPPSSDGGIGVTGETTESRCVDPTVAGMPETPETVETPVPEFVETVETVEAIEAMGISGGCCPAGSAEPIETPCCVETVETVEPGLVLIPAGMFWKSAGGGMGRMLGESRDRSLSILEEKKMDWGTRTGDTESVRTGE